MKRSPMRSVYPQLGLEAVIAYVKRKSSEVLSSALMTRKEALVLLGFSENSGGGQTVLGSLGHYGFFEHVGEKYRFTSSIKQIIGAETDVTVRNKLLDEAAIKPIVFNKLAKLSDSSEVDITQVENVIKKYNIPSSKAHLILENYRDSRNLSTHAAGTDSQFKPDSEKGKKDTHPTEMTVLIDFGNGIPVPVSKKLILNAYLEDLQKIQGQLI